ncbi:flagellar hook-length control protein FliK [bacterium]|nr:MAG: flagellar hook-length control protein FliK [bacterium]
MGLPFIALLAHANAHSALGEHTTTGSSQASGDAFAALFAQHWSGPMKPARDDASNPTALSQLESLLGSMLQQPPPALTAIFDRVQSALGASPVTGTHASIASITSRIKTLLASGASTAQIETTVTQALTQAFAELSTSPGVSLDQAFVARLRTSIASALDFGSPAAQRALGPPASGPPGNAPPATQAAALAQRIAQIATAIVGGADTGETGQQFRNLASTLDPSGRGLPAPQVQTVGDPPSPAVASSSPSVPEPAPAPAGIQPAARSTMLQLPMSTAGTPVRIDPQLASLISVLALARDGAPRGQSADRGTLQQNGASSGAWLGALAGVQPHGSAGASTAPALAGAAQPQPSNPFDRYQVVDQVARALAVRPSDGTTTLRLHLVPDSLGDVSVKLVVGPSGVSASFTAATPAAGAALQQGADQLGRAFAGHGLQLQQFSVNVGADPNGGFAYRQPQSFYTPFTRHGGSRNSYDDEESLAAIPSFGPPATVRPLGYLDYLV